MSHPTPRATDPLTERIRAIRQVNGVSSITQQRLAKSRDDVRGTLAVCKRTGATERQLSRWAALGLLPGHRSNPGSGATRRYTDAQEEIIRVFVRLTPFGLDVEALEVVAALLAEERVASSGEWLLVRRGTFSTAPVIRRQAEMPAFDDSTKAVLVVRLESWQLDQMEAT